MFIHAPIALAQGDFAGGAGTETEPYLIATAAHLDNVRDYPDAHFRLIADINLGVAPYSEGEGWVPIGTTGTPFTGNFDGDVYVIFNLTVNRSGTNYQGLFGYLSGATVKNLYLENVSVRGGQYTGGLTGRANNSTIEHVHVTGEINGVQDTGGLVGYLGGGSNVAHASSEVVVQGGECTSGLVGYVDNADDTIYHAYTLGTVDGGLYTGGLVGRLYRGTVSDSYNRAAVSGSDTVGGAVGYVNLSTSYVYHTYSTGAVTATATTYLGGLVGRSGGTVTESYWDTESSGLATSAGGTGKTTAEMQQRATYAHYNFYTLWRIDEGNDYPIFQELSNYAQPQPVTLTGAGTTENPYLITTADELHAMRQALTATFRLANDIDLAATVTWDAGRGWLPLGDSTTPFTGTLDGAGYTLFNLTVNRPTASYQGLFGYLDGATVQNVSLENVSVQGSTYTGGLAGHARDSSLADVAVSGEVTGRSNYTGGMIGYLDGGSVTGATSGVSVRGTDYTGGVVGRMSGGSVGHAAGTVMVEGGNYTGGVAGRMESGALLYKSYSLGTVVGNERVGGLVGHHTSGYPAIVDSYSRAAVSGSNHVGGAVGWIYNGDIYRTYSTGVVTATGSSVGGFVGRWYSSNPGTLADSYWDIETSGLATSAGSGAVGKTTVEMQQQATYAHYNFYAVWQIDEGHDYPTHQGLSGYAAPQAVDLATLDGDGTPGNPYLITTADELHAMRQALTATFRLANDIDLAATVAWDAGRGWLPIGDTTTPFTGTLDGDGHTLYNLTVNRPANWYQGLFGYLDGANIEDLRLENVRVYGAGSVGGLAGKAADSSLVDVAVSGEVTGISNDTGGLIGNLDGGNLTGATSGVSVRGADYTGGVVGRMSGGSVTGATSGVSVRGAYYTGGVVGRMYGGSVGYTASSAVVEGGNYTGGVAGRMESGALLYESYSLGTVAGNGYVGGLVGYHLSSDSVIVDSYSRAAVSGSSHVGGAVGYIHNSNVYRTYSTGVVTGTSDVGGLVGRLYLGTVADSYWDTETSEQGNSDGGTGKTTAEMQQQATYAHYNFYAVWQIDEGSDYPVFQDLSGYAAPQAVNLADLAGDGTPGSPYLITSADELNAMRQALTATYQLANDIDLAATVAWDAGRGWLPLGDSTTPFTGTLDGDGYALYNLTINRPGGWYQGLFGYLDGATVENLRLENVRVYGATSVGGLAGKAENSAITDVAVSGEVTGRSNDTGGLIGELVGGSVTGATSGVSVRGADYTGGVVGRMSGGSVGHAASSAVVDGSSNTGGVVGQTTDGALLYESYNLGTVAGNGSVGGLVGYHHSSASVIVDSYSQAAVAGTGDNVGGAVGYIRDAGVYRTYSTGAVTTTGSYVGGLVGNRASYHGGTVADSYWDTETSDQATSAGSGAVGKTTAEMQQQATYAHYNFYAVWQIDEGHDYPTHQDVSGYPPLQPMALAELDGDGTSSTPYLITNAAELHAMRQALTATFQLENDIDLAATVVWDAGRGWLPIGDATTPFTGTLDGDGHTLYNLTVNRPTASNQGLFGYLDGATVENLRLENVRVYGAAAVGGLAGKAEDSSITDVAVNGEVTGRSNYTGGLIGDLDGGSLTGATSGVSVRGADYTAGVVGRMSGGSVGHAASSAVVDGSSNTGGVVGQTTDGALLYESYNLGTVAGNGSVGGLVGYHHSSASVIVDSYSQAAVAGTGNNVGGAVGYIRDAGVYRTYSTGAVTTTGSYVGGLVGNRASYHGGTVADSYWDTETSDQATSAGSGAVGKTTAEMQQQATFTNWDFDNVWAIVEDTTYPYQRQTAANLALYPMYDTYPSSVSATSTITVVANITWTATTTDTWITVTGGSSGTGSGVISYTIAANPDPALRDGVITISSESAGITRTFRVRQGGTPLPFITSFPTSRNHNSAASTGHAIDITANVTWTATTDATWITLTGGTDGTGSGVISYTIAANPDPALRDDVITISSESAEITRTFRVRQGGRPLPFLTSFPTSRNHNSTASTGHAIDITSNVTWTATADATWITLTGGTDGTGSGVISYTIAANPDPALRDGVITISSEGAGITLTFQLRQEGTPLPFLTSFPTSRNHNSAASTGHAINITANVTWTATTDATWITLTDGTVGMDSGVISYTIAANPDPTPRDDVITISSERAGITLTFQLRQEGTPLPFLTIFPGSRNYNSAASTGHAIDITSNVTWTAQATDAWITLTSADEGADDGTLSYRLDNNPSLAPRTGTIEIVGGGLTRTFTVTQAGALPYLSVAPEHHHLDWIASAGHEIAVSANISWTAATATDWITVTGGSSGTGDGVITYSVAANLAPASRLGTITLTDGAKTWPFRVHQARSWAVTLSADPEAGGTLDGTGHYAHGEVVPATATANPVWDFVNWTEDDVEVSLETTYIFTATRNRALTAHFLRHTGTLSVTLEPEAARNDGAQWSIDAGETWHGSDDELELPTGTYTVTYQTLAAWDAPDDTPVEVIKDGATTLTGTYTLKQYTLTLLADPVAGGEVAGAGIYEHGQQAIITATENLGWTFAGWTGGVVSETNPLTLTVTDHLTLTATFTQDEYTLDVNTVGEGEVDVAPEQAAYVYGDVITLTATADPGWTFVEWGGDVTGSTAQITHTLTANTAITATFSQIEYTLDVNTVGEGQVAVEPEQAAYTYDQVITLTAVAEPGWTFDGWSGDVSGTDEVITHTITANTAVTATFSQDAYTLTVNTVGEGEVAVEPEQAAYVYGEVLTLTATTDPGWTFIAWSGDVSGTDEVITHTITANTAVTATFSQDAYTLDVNTVGEGEVAVEPEQAAYTYDQVITLTAVAEPGWTFDGWSGDVSGTDEVITHTITANTAVTATFTQDEYILDVNTVGEGEVDVTPEQAAYTYGQVITLTATADPGWAFVEWGGDVSGTDEIITHTLTANTAVTATFGQDTYTLTVQTVGEGEVDVAPEQAAYTYGQVITLTATADPGWTFVEWGGDVSGTDEVITHTLTANTAVTATFSQDDFKVYLPLALRQ